MHAPISQFRQKICEKGISDLMVTVKSDIPVSANFQTVQTENLQKEAYRLDRDSQIRYPSFGKWSVVLSGSSTIHICNTNTVDPGLTLQCLANTLGPVVQSIVSLTNSLRGQLVKCFMTL